MKVTAEQIQLIDKALIKIGINYADIRYEMTDHIAADLEQKDDRFEHHLKGYMLQNKSELKRTNRRFIFIAMGGAYKKFFTNMLKPWSLVIFAAMFALGMLLIKSLGREDAVMALFYFFIAFSCLLSTPVIYKALTRKNQHSLDFGFSFINLIILYPTIYMVDYQTTIENDIMVALYYAVVILISVIMHITMWQFNKQFKLRYNG